LLTEAESSNQTDFVFDIVYTIGSILYDLSSNTVEWYEIPPKEFLYLILYVDQNAENVTIS